jgi:phage terminase large subunit-like protein
LGQLFFIARGKYPRDLWSQIWQRKVLRQYRHGYVSVAKQNGKSFLFGGLPLYHLLMEDELNPEAYGCAAAKDQAGIVFKAAARLVNANSDLRARLRLLESTKRILRRDGGDQR